MDRQGYAGRSTGGTKIRTERLKEQAGAEHDLERKGLEFAAAVVRLVQSHESAIPQALATQVLTLGAQLGASVAEAYVGTSKRHLEDQLNQARRQARIMEYWLKLLAISCVVPQADVTPCQQMAHTLHADLTQVCAQLRHEREKAH